MIEYNFEGIAKAAAEVEAGGDHLEAVKRWLPQILEPQIHNIQTPIASTKKLKAAVFNMEQGHYSSLVSAYFKFAPHLKDVDVILANEIDCGMARTGNRNVADEIARALGMNYVFANEFLSRKAYSEGNETGLHGNAVFSRYPIKRATVVELDVEYDWFHWESDPRLGLRNAVLAEIEVDGHIIGLVSVHLENRTSPEGRRRQLATVFDAVDQYFGASTPILLGGDLNTNGFTARGGVGPELRWLADNPGEQWAWMGSVPEHEPIFELAASRGYDYAGCNVMNKPTRRNVIKDGSIVLLNLDWFFSRGLECSHPLRVESIFRSKVLVEPDADYSGLTGQEMSDHDVILVEAKTAS
ncbi:MAG: endonuclease/exonuclease/phosphatase family protein [Propionibacteriaceae bacterium]|jgi:hypothetical protein|nr:endonuclease/exonuclease/phosphatase family protein [Propionibacteriaceae bacterium]